MSSSSAFAALKAREGYRELWGNVIRSNTRHQRALQSQGWELKSHPEHEDLMGFTSIGDDKLSIVTPGATMRLFFWNEFYRRAERSGLRRVGRIQLVAGRVETRADTF